MTATPVPSSRPYRDAAPPPPLLPEDSLDERVLLYSLALVGALRVGAVVLSDGVWDGEVCVLGLLATLSARRLFALERETRPLDDPPR